MKIDVMKNKDKILRLLSTTRRKGMPEFIGWLVSTDFFTAPASAKFHLNVEGGLAFHSLSVYNTFDNLVSAFWKGKYIAPSTRIIVGLLHDICKIGIYHKNDKKDSEWKYKRDDLLPVGHGDKSVILILQHGLELTNQEIAMIRWHMAMYDQAYYRNSNDVREKFPEAKLLYFADDISTQYLEEVE